jgi:hypothetical protein
MLCIAYAHNAYDYARSTYVDRSRKAIRIARGIFLSVQQFDTYCFRSAMKGLLQLSFELRRSLEVFALILGLFYAAVTSTSIRQTH